MKKVLFLDDEESILNTYRRMIRNIDVEGFFAKDSIEAQRILDRNTIDLIISDYRLQQETGLDLLRAVRLYNDSVPMIIISGYAQETFIKNALTTNVIQDYLIKPVSMQEFGQLIERYVSRNAA